MSYVLVSLTGDEATAANDLFAQWFAKTHPPHAAFHEEHPNHNAVADAVRQAGNALVFGHDGVGSVRGKSLGEPWVDPQTFGQIFSGSRVWVYACDTRSKNLEEDLTSFGRVASGAGVQVFAGFAAPVTAVPPFSTLEALRTPIYQALARGFRAFISGENSAENLKKAVLRGAATGRGAVLAASQIERDIQTLRVLVSPTV
ncbi:MAG: hypothetical protein IPK82_22230 [Polyangiaceae bacterium]|nr:hypothetical protein [Polyangiaceae bacterium]